MAALNKQNLIAQDIASKIKHKIYQTNTYLPSEHQLCDLYGTSRETIRKALDQLNELGLIQKIKGRGSLVLDIQRYTFPISGITSFKELNATLGMHAVTKILHLKKTTIPPCEISKSAVKGQPGFFVERLRLIADTPAVLDRDYLLTPPVTKLPKAAAADSIYDYLENDLGLNISYATKEITVEKPDDTVRQALDLPSDGLVVAVRSHSYLADTTLFQITASFHRPDKFKFIDFARRKRVLSSDKPLGGNTSGK
ncbi:trehalose operon repressor [Liquorilactobacillus ghanensis]|uniref:trehalose operon repressor n=1 Tax=Liquorilactobacillus ghanensis TaxID=399370 RepID=UPI0039E83A65